MRPTPKQEEDTSYQKGTVVIRCSGVGCAHKTLFTETRQTKEDPLTLARRLRFMELEHAAGRHDRPS